MEAAPSTAYTPVTCLQALTLDPLCGEALQWFRAHESEWKRHYRVRKGNVPWKLEASEALISVSCRVPCLIPSLIALGADAKTNDSYALVRAAHCQTAQGIEALLSAGADPLARDSQCLVEAVRYGDIEITDILLEAGADARAQESAALHHAARCGFTRVARRLLDAGADPLAKDGVMLVDAAAGAHLSVVELLLQRADYSFAQMKRAVGRGSPDCRDEITRVFLQKRPGAVVEAMTDGST